MLTRQTAMAGCGYFSSAANGKADKLTWPAFLAYVFSASQFPDYFLFAVSI